MHIYPHVGVLVLFLHTGLSWFRGGRAGGLRKTVKPHENAYHESSRKLSMNAVYHVLFRKFPRAECGRFVYVEAVEPATGVYFSGSHWYRTLIVLSSDRTPRAFFDGSLVTQCWRCWGQIWVATISKRTTYTLGTGWTST